MRRILELPIAWQTGTRRPLPRAHGVALAGDRETRAARLADVAGNEVQVVDGADAVAAVGGLVDAHGPERHRRIRLAVEPRHRADGVFVDAADLRRRGGIVVCNQACELVEAVGVGADVRLVVQAVFENHMAQAVQQHQIGARRHRQMYVGHLGEHRHPGIDDDHWKLARLQGFLESPVDDRMLLRQIRAERQQALGMFEVAVAPRRPIRTERALVAGHRRRHAQGGVAVVVVGADDAAHQLAERVELFGHDLAGGNHRHGIAPVARLDALELVRHAIQRGIPIRVLPGVGRALAHFWRTAAPGRTEYLRLR